MENEYKKIVLLVGLEAIQDYEFRLIKSLLAKELKMTRKMQDDYDRIRIADLMEEKFQNDSGLRKLIALCRDIPALANLAETLEKRRLKVKRKSKGERKSTVKKGQQDEPTTAPSPSPTKTDSGPKSKEEIPLLKENKIKESEDPEGMHCPWEQSQSLTPSATSKEKTECHPQTPHGPQPTPLSSPPIKRSKIKNSVSLVNEQENFSSNLQKGQKMKATNKKNNMKVQEPEGQCQLQGLSEIGIKPSQCIFYTPQMPPTAPSGRTHTIILSLPSCSGAQTPYMSPTKPSSRIQTHFSTTSSREIQSSHLPPTSSNSLQTSQVPPTAPPSSLQTPQIPPTAPSGRTHNPHLSPSSTRDIQAPRLSLTPPSRIQTPHMSSTKPSSRIQTHFSTTSSREIQSPHLFPESSSGLQTPHVPPSAPPSSLQTPQVPPTAPSGRTHNPHLSPSSSRDIQAPRLSLTPSSRFQTPHMSSTKPSDRIQTSHFSPTSAREIQSPHLFPESSSDLQTPQMPPTAPSNVIQNPQVCPAIPSTSQQTPQKTPTSFSSSLPMNRRLTTIPKEASKEYGYQKGPKEVMVLKTTEPFTYEVKECEKRMFHATVATESEFFRVKVFDISVKDKFIPRKVIAISDYIGRNGFLEIYSASSVSDVSANRKMEISWRLLKNANATPKIEYLCSQCTVKYVNGVYTVYKKNVRKDCTYYEIQDNTGRMEVVVYGRLTYVNCEEGDKLKLFCFELAFSADKWQLRSVFHSYIKVIKTTKKTKTGPLNPNLCIDTSQESS